MEVLVVYGGEAQPWEKFLKSKVTKQKPNAKFVSFADHVFIRKPQQDQQRHVNQAQVIVLIVSPNFVECMERETRMNWNPLIPDMSRVLIVFCGTEEDELKQIKSRLPDHPNCVHYDASQDATAMVDKVVEIYSKEKTYMDQSTATGQGSVQSKLKKTRAKPPKSPKSRQEPEESSTIKIVPDHGPCDKNTEVYLFLDNKFEGASLRVRQEGREDSDRQILDVVQVNDQLYQCTVYQHAVGKVKLRLFSDDSCVGVAHFTYDSPLRDQEQLSHSYIQMLDTLLKESEKDTLRMAEIDSLLHSALELSGNDGLSKMFKLYDYYDNFKPSLQELPTILHLAARYGLKELCSSLLDMQGAVPAARIRNVHEHNTMDLAREHGHTDLVEYLENYNELAEEEENIYQMMYAYVNMESSHGDVNYYSGSDNDYLPMSGHKASQRAKEPDNTRCRFLGVPVASPSHSIIMQESDEDSEEYTIVEQPPPDRGYISMNKKQSQTPIHPPSKQTPAPFHRNEDDSGSESSDLYYSHVESHGAAGPVPPTSKVPPSYQPRRSQSMSGILGNANEWSPNMSKTRFHSESDNRPEIEERRAFTLPHREELFDIESVVLDYDKSKPTGKVPKGSPVTHSLSQQELIDIIEGVKKGEFTMDEADSFFRTWQDRYRSLDTTGFDKKKENLKRRQNELTQLGAREGDMSSRGFMSFLKGIGKKKPIEHATVPTVKEGQHTREYRRQVPSVPRSVEEDPAENRSSTCSNSSSSSRGSRASASSLNSQSDSGIALREDLDIVYEDTDLLAPITEPAGTETPPLKPKPSTKLISSRPPAPPPKPITTGSEVGNRASNYPPPAQRHGLAGIGLGELSNSPVFQRQRGNVQEDVGCDALPQIDTESEEMDFEDRIDSIPLESPPPPPLTARPRTSQEPDLPPPPIPPRRR